MRIVLQGLLVVYLATGAAGAAGAAEKVQAPDRADGLHLMKQDGVWSVGRGGRPARPVQLPDGFRAFRIEPLDGGWIATGTAAAPDGFTDLVIVRGEGRRVEELPLPSERFGVDRANPVPVVRDGLLLGLAWVEGNHEEDLAVRAAEWNGTDWGRVELVSPRRPGGAQLALSGTVLGNGDWLLLWAGWDGEDDEILWSRRGSDAWSVPERVHADNDTPDITPTVVATADGAMAAWSVLHEGHYRLRVAEFSAAGWEVGPPSEIEGSVYPQAFRNGRAVEILFLSVIPEGWNVLEIDSGGLAPRRVFLPGPTTERPLLLPSDASEVTLGWVGERPGELGRQKLSWERQ